MPLSKASNKTRLQQLRASCDGCFLAKVKCSKTRPICSRCLTCGTDCKYSPSSRVGKPSTDKQISNSNINASGANRDTNIDEALHFALAFDSQAIPIATDKKKNPVSRINTNWSILSGSADGNTEISSSANTTPSLRDDALFDTCDLGLPSSTTELLDPTFPYTPISQNELNYLVLQNDEGTMMSWPRSLGAVPQLNSFSPWFDRQPSDLPLPPCTNADLPSPNASIYANSPPDCRTNARVSSSSCNCFTTCLQSLQALHNHSITTRLVPAFDMTLAINQKAVERCDSMLACSKCVSKSGSNTTTMLLATIMEKILSFYQIASQSDFSGTIGTDTQTSIGSYRVATEDGHWLRSEILWRELRRLEEVFGRFREVCGRNERDKDASVCYTLLGHLSQSLKFAYEELIMRQNSVSRNSRFYVRSG